MVNNGLSLINHGHDLQTEIGNGENLRTGIKTKSIDLQRFRSFEAETKTDVPKLGVSTLKIEFV